jgi:hypothetical protein
MLAHHCWVYPLDPCFDPFSRDHAPPHIKLCLPFDVARNLAQLRIGSAHLEVEQGRKRRVSVPRADHLCRLCCGEDATLSHRRAVLARARTGTSSNVEDLKHFMLECPVYDDLRAACPAFPLMYSETLSGPACVRSVFQHGAQSAHGAHSVQDESASRTPPRSYFGYLTDSGYFLLLLPVGS